jgi:hypothetical protein
MHLECLGRCPAPRRPSGCEAADPGGRAASPRACWPRARAS